MKRKKLTRPATLDGIEFDALISQEEQYSASAPDYPVESGYKVHDSIAPNPLVIRTTLYLTNTPVTWAERIGRSRTRVQDVEERLREIFWSREPVTFETSDNTWDNMCITSMTISKTADDGYSRRIPIELKQIEVTSTKTGTVPDSYVRGGASEASAGTASTRAATSEATPVSSGTGSGGAGSKQNQQKAVSHENASMLYKAGKGLGLIK